MIQQFEQLKIQSTCVLPIDSNSKVQHLALIKSWVVVSINTNLIFIKLKNQSHFKIFQQIQIQRLIHLQEDILLAVNEHNIYLFVLSEKDVFFRFIYITNFLDLHSICSFINRSLILAGVDVKYNLIATQKPSKKRYIYFIKNLTSYFKKLREQSQQSEPLQKRLLYDQKMLIVELQNDSKSPISHVSTFLQQKMVLSCFQNKIFIHNLQTAQKLSELNLKNKVIQAFPIPHLFNLYNVLIRTDQKQLIRIGVQINGQKMGCQLQKLKLDKIQEVVLIQKFKDNEVNQNNQHKKQQRMEIFVLQKGLLLQYNYFTKKIKNMVDFSTNNYSSNQKITKLPNVICQQNIDKPFLIFLKDQTIVKQIRYFNLS